MRYLLDTNVLSELIRQPGGDLAQLVLSYDEADICTSIIAAAELRFGVARRGSGRLALQVERLLGPMQIVPVESPVDHVYGRLRSILESAGQPIGNNDLWIASQAVAWNLTIITDNVREFSRIDELRLENWLRDA